MTILPIKMKSSLRRVITWRYGTETEIYFKAIKDHLHNQSSEFRAAVAALGKYDDRIIEHHVASKAKEANLLKVKIRLVSIRDFVMQQVGHIDASERAIDVGAASGVFLEMLGKKGLGIDVWEPSVRAMESYGMEALLCGGESIPLEDGSFDYGFAFETLEHAESPLLVLKEMGRLCAKGVFISIPFRTRSRIVERDTGRTVTAQHIFEFSPADFHRLSAHCGLQVKAQGTVMLHDAGKGAEGVLRRRSGYDKPSVALFFLQHLNSDAP